MPSLDFDGDYGRTYRKSIQDSIPGHDVLHEIARAAIQTAASDAQRVLATLRRTFPQAGSYGNETDYFLKDAGQAQWGPHLERLQAIKRRVDPSNLFRVHNGIGNLKA